MSDPEPLPFFQGQKVLVTGGAGMLGGAVVSRLAASGAVVRATLHTRRPWREHPDVEYLTSDLTRPEDCRAAVAGARYVFHCAANTSGALITTTTPLVHVTPNVVMNTYLLDAAYQAGVEKLLWMGSSTGYRPADHPVKEEEMFVGDPYDSYFFVGHMKRFTEVLCRMYGEKLPRPMTTIVMRATNVYGPGDKFDPERSHVTAALIRKALERMDPLEVWGDGTEVRDLIYVDDAVEAMLRAVVRLSGHVALNLGYGQVHSVREILALVLELTGYGNARVTFAPHKPTTIPARVVDVSKAEALLDFRAPTGLRQGLLRTIDWYRRQR